MTPKQDPTWSNGSPELLYSTVQRLGGESGALQQIRVADADNTRSYFQPPVVLTDQLGRAMAERPIRRGRFNLIRFAIDSFCAQAVNVPSMDVTTTGGGYSQRRSAEALGLWIDGVFAANDMQELAWRCTIDSCLTRVAAVKVDTDGADGMTVTRLQPNWLIWKPGTGVDPRELFTRMPIPRASLIAKFGADEAKRKMIEDAPPYKPDPLWDGIDGIVDTEVIDMVEVFEGYRKALPGEKDSGHYTCAVAPRGDTGVLEDRAHSEEFHRIVPLRGGPSFGSFGGKPVCDDLMDYQAELDDFAATIKEAFVKGAAFRVLVDRGADVDPKQLSNVQGQVIEKNSGTSVQFVPGATLPPEYIAREEVIIKRAFEFLGLSYNAARGVKADGISSAKGQREVASIAQNRLVLQMQNIQNWLVRIAKTIIGVADSAYEGKKDIAVTVPGGRMLRRVKWSEIDYKQENFEISCDAINALSRHPAARVEEVLELTQAKILTEREALSALGNKDLQSVRDRAFAKEDCAEKLIELALGGDLRQPDPYMGADGLQMLIERGEQSYIEEMVQEKPSEFIGDLRRLIESAKTMLEELQPPPAPAAAPPASAMPGPGDMAVPGAGLPSDLPPAAAAPPVPGQGLA